MTASARSLPALMCSMDGGMSAEHDLHLSADKVGQGGRVTAIRHMNHVDTGHHLEQFAGEMLRSPVAARGHS